MNKSLCALICFLVGILVYSIIRSYCSCDVIEGSIKWVNKTKINLRKKKYGKCQQPENASLCGWLADSNNIGHCGSGPGPATAVDICDVKSYDDLLGGRRGSCQEIDNLLPEICHDSEDADKLLWFKWYMGDESSSCTLPPNFNSKTCSSGGTPTPPSCPIPLSNPKTDGTCPLDHPSKCAFDKEKCSATAGRSVSAPYPCCDYRDNDNRYLDFECKEGKCVAQPKTT
jgi:hypothetical protein